MLAKKIEKYVIEPQNSGFSKDWESFHATNPSCMRLKECKGVFLAYRAGGEKDRFFNGSIFVYGSSMGLAILDENGEEVKYRFPLPIFTMDRGEINLPQNNEEFEDYMVKYSQKVVLFHDFRFVNHGNFIYVVTHNGGLTFCYDSIYRVKTDIFLEKIKASIFLIDSDNVNKKNWAEIWYNKTVFQPCGVEGTCNFYGSTVTKNDIVMLECDNGKMQICHRILPDYGVIDTNGEHYLQSTPDGITKYGNLENCVRPGYFDNSHVGSNGNPIRAKIGNQDVFIDVVHGVNNYSLSVEEANKAWDMTYLPFFRIKDAYDGATVFYSDEPILEMDNIWKEYAEEGAWVSQLEHLRGVIFAGGQVAKYRDKITENDTFIFYTGIGDTAVARAEFTINSLVNSAALYDIKNLIKAKELAKSICVDNSIVSLDNVGNWTYAISNINGQICIVRELSNCKIYEKGIRKIQRNAGYFDFIADEMLPSSVYKSKYGYIVGYKGYSFDNNNVVFGYGVMIFKSDNPEKLYYRSPISITKLCVLTDENKDERLQFSCQDLLNKVPEKVKFEILKTEEFIKNGKTFESDLTKWLLKKSEVNS